MKLKYCFHCEAKRPVTNQSPSGSLSKSLGPYLWCKVCGCRISKYAASQYIAPVDPIECDGTLDENERREVKSEDYQGEV
jgi:hypothetical protein